MSLQRAAFKARLLRAGSAPVLDSADIEVHGRLREAIVLEKENSALKGRIVALERDVRQWKDYNGVAETRLKEQLAGARTEAAEAAKESEASRAVLAARDAELARLETELEGLRAPPGERAAPKERAVAKQPPAPKVDRAPELEALLRAAETDGAKAQDAARELMAEVTLLRTELAAAEEAMETADLRCTVLTENVGQLQDDVSRVRETNRMLTAQGEEKGIQIRERGRELTALREQVAKLKRDAELRNMRVAEERKRLDNERRQAEVERARLEESRAERKGVERRREADEAAAAANAERAAEARARRAAEAAERRCEAAEQVARTAEDQVAALEERVAAGAGAEEARSEAAAALRAAQQAEQALAERDKQVTALQDVLAREARNAECHQGRAAREREAKVRDRRGAEQLRAVSASEQVEAVRAEAQAQERALRQELAAAEREAGQRERQAKCSAAAEVRLRRELDSAEAALRQAAVRERALLTDAESAPRRAEPAAPVRVEAPRPGPPSLELPDSVRSGGSLGAGISQIQYHVEVLQRELVRAGERARTSAWSPSCTSLDGPGSDAATPELAPPRAWSVCGSATPELWDREDWMAPSAGPDLTRAASAERRLCELSKAQLARERVPRIAPRPLDDALAQAAREADAAAAGLEDAWDATLASAGLGGSRLADAGLLRDTLEGASSGRLRTALAQRLVDAQVLDAHLAPLQREADDDALIGDFLARC